jgi:DNA-binding NtrC family response regulator
VAATNRDLSAAIEGGRFRLDLYHRLSVIQLTIPPLRARREEIVPLAEHFLRLYGRKYNLNPPPLSQDAASRLIAHDWPGNVRELRNVIERAMVLEDSGTVHASSIRFTMERVPGETSKAAVEPGAVPDGPPTIAHAERELILRALQHCGNNQTQAAQELGVTRDILRHRMKKYGLFRPKNRA